MVIIQKPSKYILVSNEGENKVFAIKQGDSVNFTDEDGEVHEAVVIKLGSKEMIVNEDESFDRIYGYHQLKNVEII